MKAIRKKTKMKNMYIFEKFYLRFTFSEGWIERQLYLKEFMVELLFQFRLIAYRYRGTFIDSLFSLLVSFKGPKGGFQLVKTDIALYDIVKAIDGSDIMERCILGLEDCSSESPCPVHSRYTLIRGQLRETLLSTNILDFNTTQGN